MWAFSRPVCTPSIIACKFEPLPEIRTARVVISGAPIGTFGKGIITYAPVYWSTKTYDSSWIKE
jgi:hypothetical protein